LYSAIQYLLSIY